MFFDRFVAIADDASKASFRMFDMTCLFTAHDHRSMLTRRDEDFHVAIDGSHCPDSGLAGYGVTVTDDRARVGDRCDELSVMSKVPGKQTINRAEGFGVATACDLILSNRCSGNSYVHIDSQLTIDGIHRMFVDPDTARVIQNYSAIRTCFLRLQSIRDKGGTIVFVAVDGTEVGRFDPIEAPVLGAANGGSEVNRVLFPGTGE